MVADKRKIKINVPEPTLIRLPGYLHYLQQIRGQGIINISAPMIGAELHIDPTQVVKDLSYTGIKGKPRVGYNTYELLQAIENYLGFNIPREAFLFGAGNLGSALLSYPELLESGIKIIAAFDVDTRVVGSKKGKVDVFHMDMYNELQKRLNVEIAILTTPVNVAQKVTDLIIGGGIKAIWNFSPTRLNTPKEVVVQNTSMYSNAALLLKKMDSLKNETKES